MKKFLVVICSVVLAFASLVVSQSKLRSQGKRRWFKPKVNNRSPVRFRKPPRAVFLFLDVISRMSALVQSRHLMPSIYVRYYKAHLSLALF